MAVIDDLVVSGLSFTQAQAVVGVDAGTANANTLVQQGFSYTQALAIVGVNEGTATVVDLVKQGLWGTQATAIVAALSTKPTANAGVDQTVDVDEEVTLNGSGSSAPDGGSLTYAWTLTSAPEGSTATLTGATTVSPKFTPNVAGAYVATLVVNDGAVSSNPDTVTVTAVTV